MAASWSCFSGRNFWSSWIAKLCEVWLQYWRKSAIMFTCWIASRHWFRSSSGMWPSLKPGAWRWIRLKVCFKLGSRAMMSVNSFAESDSSCPGSTKLCSRAVAVKSRVEREFPRRPNRKINRPSSSSSRAKWTPCTWLSIGWNSGNKKSEKKFLVTLTNETDWFVQIDKWNSFVEAVTAHKIDKIVESGFIR